MRCEDLTRELASPTGALPPAEMAGHLAACPACARWSRDASRFDRIWEATRPIEPSMDALDALWARVSHELDGHKAPTTLKFVRPDRHRRWAMAAFVAAQAAAILIAALVLLRLDPAKPIQVADANIAEIAKPEPFDLVLELDEQAVVRLDKKNRPSVEKFTRSPDDASSSIPTDTPHFEMEAMETADFTWGPSVAIQ